MSAEIHFKLNLCNFQTNATIYYTNKSCTFIENAVLNGKTMESQASLSKSWSALGLVSSGINDGLQARRSLRSQFRVPCLNHIHSFLMTHFPSCVLMEQIDNSNHRVKFPFKTQVLLFRYQLQGYGSCLKVFNML